MPHPTSRPRQSLLAYAYLTPFAVLALYGLAALTGWWTGQLALIQPRSYDPALSANACLCFFSHRARTNCAGPQLAAYRTRDRLDGGPHRVGHVDPESARSGFWHRSFAGAARF